MESWHQINHQNVNSDVDRLSNSHQRVSRQVMTVGLGNKEIGQKINPTDPKCNGKINYIIIIDYEKKIKI